MCSDTTRRMLFHFLTRSHFVRLPGVISEDHPVLSGIPQVTVLGLLLFLIMISDIVKDVPASKLVSFADDTKHVSNSKKFSYVCFSSNMSAL